MPKQRKRRTKRKVVRRKPIQGQGPVGDWFKKTFSKRNLKKANNFLRKHKVISRTANVLDDFGVPRAAKIGRVAKNLGYGRSGGGRKKKGQRYIKV